MQQSDHTKFYGLDWPRPHGHKWTYGELADIEIYCIRQGGEWIHKGKKVGAGLFHHFKRLHKILWPEDFWTRWDDLMLEEMLKHQIIGIAGPASSGKTHRCSTMMLCRYWVSPTSFTGICSTTTRDSLNLRVFAEVKKYFNLAKRRHPNLPGHIIDSKQMITTDGKEVEGREFRNGIVGVACIKGGNFEGLANYIGIKNDEVMLLADEAQLMELGFFDAVGNLSANPWFQLVACGNPKDTMDAFGQVCEPQSGWDAHNQVDKTHAWDTRFRNGRCIRLVGTDSPNLDYPEGKEPFRKIIGRRFIKETAETYGKEHWKYLCWVLAKFPLGVLERRVITRGMCVKFHAFEEAVWGSEKLTDIFGLDAAYGSVGGDRCMGTHVKFGTNIDGKSVISLSRSMRIDVPLDSTGMPEDHVANYVKNYCETHGIPPENVFFDGTGRSSLTSAFARLWSHHVTPLEFGAKASERPDPADPQKYEHKRGVFPKLCKNAYFNFVSELWFSVRVAIETEQIRGLTESMVFEGQMRSWEVKNEHRVQVEPKDKMKDRLGRSPDEFDAFVCAVEGCRRRGFALGRLESPKARRSSQEFLKQLLQDQRNLHNQHIFEHAA